MLGAILFGTFSLFGKKETEAPARIIVSAERKANLADGFARTWRRLPTEQELQGLIDDYVRDEVFYREGKAAGFDRDDAIIRRRVRQKMEFAIEDIATVEPSEQELKAFLAAHPDRFGTEDRVTFRQIFLSATKRSATLDADVQQIAAILARTDSGVDTNALGDPFVPGEEFTVTSTTEIARIFGDYFATQISDIEQGRWQGPVSSSFGKHFVFVSERLQGSLPPLDAVRQAVQREWGNARRIEAEQKFYSKLRERYDVEVEPRPRTSIGGIR